MYHAPTRSLPVRSCAVRNFWSYMLRMVSIREHSPDGTLQSSASTQKQKPLDVDASASLPNKLANFCVGCDRVPCSMLREESVPNIRAERAGEGVNGLNPYDTCVQKESRRNGHDHFCDFNTRATEGCSSSTLSNACSARMVEGRLRSHPSRLPHVFEMREVLENSNTLSAGSSSLRKLTPPSSCTGGGMDAKGVRSTCMNLVWKSRGSASKTYAIRAHMQKKECTC